MLFPSKNVKMFIITENVSTLLDINRVLCVGSVMITKGETVLNYHLTFCMFPENDSPGPGTVMTLVLSDLDG